MNLKNISKVFGGIWIISSLIWAGLGIAGIIAGFDWLAETEKRTDENLSLVAESLTSIQGLVTETTDVLSSTQQSLTTVQVALRDAGVGLNNLRPLLSDTTIVVTSDVPEALDGVQNSMPSLIETAKTMDDTLTWLSDFEVTIPNPLGRDWRFDLGIAYEPDVPLDQALEDVNEKLADIPENLRDMEESLSTADRNLIVVSDDLAYLADDIETMSQQVHEIVPQMEILGDNIGSIQDNIENTQASLPATFATVQNRLRLILWLLIFSQIPSIYMGGLLVSGVLIAEKPSEDNQ